jgi:hypothetical protein
MKVRIINRGRENNAMCFKLQEINGSAIYTMSYCHRTESPLWKARGIQIYYGNVEFPDGNVRKGFLRIDYYNRMIVLDI